ncbi:hypothetical protein FKM82_021814 [Ascaphus truei]
MISFPLSPGAISPPCPGVAWGLHVAQASATSRDLGLIPSRVPPPPGPRHLLGREEPQLLDIPQETEEGLHLLGAGAGGDVRHLDHGGAAGSHFPVSCFNTFNTETKE